MTSKFVFMPRFDRSVKQLKKRYRNILADIEIAVEQLLSNPQTGSVIPDDYAVRKLRIASRDMQRGKSGGFRLLYWLRAIGESQDFTIYLLLIYSKTDMSDITPEQLQTLIDDLPQGDD